MCRLSSAGDPAQMKAMRAPGGVCRRDTMETLFDNLHGVAAERLSFTPAFEGRAFLLARPAGNILVYSSGRVTDDFTALAATGGIARQYLNHEHQANPSCDSVAEEFGAPLYCHAADANAAAKICNVDQTFDGRAHHSMISRSSPFPAIRRARPLSCGRMARIAISSPATPSICATANGGSPCSTA